uniref:Reverse transcriptase Ty1/copia-type domain-containing protein n=1 Tax=Fagus sylvatica TaxID=28930 RepID=A0A2N9HUJ9_FAGSY
MKFRISLNCLKDIRKLVANESTRPNETLKAILNDLKLDLWPKVSLRKGGIDYKETFSPVSKKDSLRIIMALVAFVNWSLKEEVYMDQPEGFSIEEKEHLACKLKKSISGLKQASRQWYLKFNNTITSFGFKENTVDWCIYLKESGSEFIFLILYVDDILLASSDLGILHETKKFLSKNFEMKDMDKTTYVIGIEIFRNRSRGILGLSQKAYIERVLERFKMENCSASVAPIQKGRYQSNSGMDHWKAAKKVMRYLQGTKDFMLTFRRSDSLEVTGYSNSDFAGCIDSRKSTFGYLFMLAGGAISWESAKQTIIASSTMEAEFMGAKHMELKYLTVKEDVQKQRVSIEHISTQLMVADLLTKGLAPKTFKEHVNQMGLENST